MPSCSITPRTFKASKLVVVTSSTYGRTFAKYIEAALAGCLVVGDLPQRQRNFLSKFVVEINMDDSDDHILGILRWWLEHDAERRERALWVNGSSCIKDMVPLYGWAY